VCFPLDRPREKPEGVAISDSREKEKKSGNLVPGVMAEK
jgi:hypothetical protein